MFTLKNKFINKYFEYIEGATESPQNFHLWSLLTATSAAIGRNAWLQHGEIRYYPNQYVILAGPAGVRKSTALSFVRKLLRDGATSVKFAPSDTAGQRQGLLSAMSDELDGEEDDDNFSIDQLENIEFFADKKDKVNNMFVCAGELSVFIGQKSFELITCITDLWDNPSHYSYRLKTSKFVIYKPTLSILSATTAEAMFAALPSQSVENGFLSRVILVYGNATNLRIARPKTPDPQIRSEICETFNYVNNKIKGPFEETYNAQKLLDSIYMNYSPNITDTRFINYTSRRHAHLVKIIMCLAALEKRHQILPQDVDDAQQILSITEKTMPDALGEYGMNPISIAKQRIIDFLATRKDIDLVTEGKLWALINRDVGRRDFTAALSELIQSGKLVRQKKVEKGSKREYFEYGLIRRLTEDQKIEMFGSEYRDKTTIQNFMN